MPSLSAMTFNVLVGSPLPSFLVRQYVPVLGSRKGKIRLDLQQENLREINSDIIALQELHDDRVTASYSSAFSATHLLVYGDYFNWRGALMLSIISCVFAIMNWLLLSFLLVIFSISMWLFFTLLFSKEIGERAAIDLWRLPDYSDQSFFPNLFSNFGLVLALFAAGGTILLANFSELVAVSFFTGRTHGGLGLMINKKKLRVIAHETKTHLSQRGDILNMFKPRAFQLLLVEVLDNTTQERLPSSSLLPPPKYLFIINAHTNLGEDDHRSLQFDEIVSASSTASISEFCARAGVRKFVPEDIPVLLMGDLNAESHSPSVVGLMNSGCFIDVFADYRKVLSDSGNTVPSLTWDRDNPLTKTFNIEHDKRIDYILMKQDKSSSFEVSNSTIVCSKPPFTSDHYGVFAEFSTGSTRRFENRLSIAESRVDDMNPRNSTSSGNTSPIVGGPSPDPD